jgi:hypothetical protein
LQYTTDKKAEERDWFVEAVIGDLTTATIHNLSPDTKYFFKMSARNNKGYGPPGPIVNYVTTRGEFLKHFFVNRVTILFSLIWRWFTMGNFLQKYVHYCYIFFVLFYITEVAQNGKKIFVLPKWGRIG